MVIRDARPEDAAGIAAAHIRSWQAAYRGLLPTTFLDGLEDAVPGRTTWWQRVLEATPDDLVVAERNGEVIGFARVARCRDDDHGLLHRRGEVQAIYLVESAWGLGMGRALMAEAERRIAARRLTGACLWVLEANTRARRFYEAAGWAPDGTEKTETMSGTTLHEVRYVRELS